MGKFIVQMVIFSCMAAMVAAQQMAATTELTVQPVAQTTLQQPAAQSTATPYNNVQTATPQTTQTQQPTATPYNYVQTTTPQTTQTQPTVTPYNYYQTTTSPQTTQPQQPTLGQYNPQLHDAPLNAARSEVDWYTNLFDKVVDKVEDGARHCVNEISDKFKVLKSLLLDEQIRQDFRSSMTGVHDFLTGPVLHRDTCFKVATAATLKLIKLSPKAQRTFRNGDRLISTADKLLHLTGFYLKP